MNNFKTMILMVLLIILFVIIGDLVAGKEGMIWAFMLALIMNGIVYWFSDKIVLAMYAAKELDEQYIPEIFSIIKNLTIKMQLPMPKVYIIDTSTPNAFATGRNPKNSAIVFTRGILELLDKKELTGVIAHELSHIKNRDTLISVIAATIAGAIFTLARMGQWTLIFSGRRDERNSNPLSAVGMLLTIIIGPIAALLVQMAISRSREYEADKSAAIVTLDPLSLANALKKIHDTVQKVPLNTHPTTAHLFIVNPLKGRDVFSLFSTHPPIEERIRRLEQINVELNKYSITNIIR